MVHLTCQVFFIGIPFIFSLDFFLCYLSKASVALSGKDDCLLVIYRYISLKHYFFINFCGMRHSRILEVFLECTFTVTGTLCIIKI
jgi:hypothetical protein